MDNDGVEAEEGCVKMSHMHSIGTFAAGLTWTGTSTLLLAFPITDTELIPPWHWRLIKACKGLLYYF